MIIQDKGGQAMKKLALVFAVTSLFIFAARPAQAEKVLKLGVVGPFTGPAVTAGVQIRDAVKMAFEEVGYKIGDYDVQLVWIDSQSNPAIAVRAYLEAISNPGIDAGILNWHSSVAVALMDVVAENKIPHFFAFGSTEAVNEKYRSNPEKYGYWLGKGWPKPATLVREYVEFLNQLVERGVWKPVNRLVAIYGEDTHFGRSEGQAFKRLFTETGWQVAFENYSSMNRVDFYTLLSEYKEKNVSVLAGTSSILGSISAFVKQAEEMGLKSLIIADGLGWNEGWYSLTGSASDYVLDMVPQFTTPQAKRWTEEFKKRYGYAPGATTAGLTYDGTRFFIKAAKRALEVHGKLTKETIYSTFSQEVDTGKLSYGREDGAVLMNRYQYTPDTMPDLVVGQDFYYFPIIQYMNGKGSIVYPKDWSQVEFKPKP